VKKCNSCHGHGGMVVNEDFSLDFEVCMNCDGYGFIYEDTNEDKLPKVRAATKHRGRD
jgi:DnaJ-class molecular chaperone